ncbi:inner membrane protein YiaA [Aeromonas sanarellii]|uniref:inner membrane protein YiaA n=1 Tax=Aeromonas sanarellii TaxID=633415 RepID=UPI003B9E8FA9
MSGNTGHTPSGVYKLATVACFIASVLAYLIGIWNAQMELNEKGYYLVCLMFGLFSAVSLQKIIRDESDGVWSSDKYKLLCWVASISSISLFLIGLWNAALVLSEKGFYIMAYLLALFSSATMQKNERDDAEGKRIISSEENTQQPPHES